MKDLTREEEKIEVSKAFDEMQTLAEKKVIEAARKIANSQVFPRQQNCGKGMNYEQYLIGQALTMVDRHNELQPLFIAKTAILYASSTILELAKQQLENE